MTVDILAFGIAKEIMGGAKVAVTVTDEIVVENLKSQLGHQFPRLKDLKSFMIAVNGEYARPGQVIAASDEVAIIPPVSGG